ncbi:hypothetical protein RvY_17243, partial [Ramazzottius varieornatus]
LPVVCIIIIRSALKLDARRKIITPTGEVLRPNHPHYHYTSENVSTMSLQKDTTSSRVDETANCTMSVMTANPILNLNVPLYLPDE